MDLRLRVTETSRNLAAKKVTKKREIDKINLLENSLKYPNKIYISYELWIINYIHTFQVRFAFDRNRSEDDAWKSKKEEEKAVLQKRVVYKVKKRRKVNIYNINSLWK